MVKKRKAKMGCEFQDKETIQFFENTNCQGQVKSYEDSGVVTLEKYKSMIIPENYEVTFSKNNALVKYNHKLWGTYIDDVSTTIDVWQQVKEETTFHLSYEDAENAVIHKLGERSHLIASSCVGLLEFPIKDYEPIKNNKINTNCEIFLDNYCSSHNEYEMEVCKHRKVFVPQQQETNNTSNDDWLVYLYLALFLLFIVVIYIVVYKFKIKRDFKKDLYYNS